MTLFMTLLAGFQVLLSGYAGQEDVVVGTPVANRNREEIEGLIGFFVNTLVLRTDLTGEPSVRELLGRVKEVALGAYAASGRAVREAGGGVAAGAESEPVPLFQVMFALAEHAERWELELQGLRVESVCGGAWAMAKFD